MYKLRFRVAELRRLVWIWGGVGKLNAEFPYNRLRPKPETLKALEVKTLNPKP